MSKELKPYERENIIIKRLRECRNSKQYIITMINATKRGLERSKRTHERDLKVYSEELEKANATLEQLEKKIRDYSNALKEFLPKPKTKIESIAPKTKDDKIECDICGKYYSKPGFKSHRKACLKKIELSKLRDEIEKLELEETLEEAIDLDELTEDVSFIKIEEPKEEEGD